MLPQSVIGTIRGAAVRCILALTGLIVALGGVWWLARAAFTGLLEVMDPAWAACITGIGMLLLALLLCVPMLTGGRRKARGYPSPEQAHPASATAAMAGEEAARAIRDRPGTAAMAALAAGMLVGYSPKLRRALRDLLR